MTHLKAQETKRSPAARKQWKLALIKRLYERGYDRSAILNLFTFVDWIMILPKATKVEFWQELKVYEEERKMRYITSVEQIGYDRGQSVGYDRGVEAEAQRSRELILEAQERLLEAQRSSQERLLEAQRSFLIRLLTRKIGSMSVNTIDRINSLPIEQLESLGEALLDFGSIDDLTSWLETQG